MGTHLAALLREVALKGVFFGALSVPQSWARTIQSAQAAHQVLEWGQQLVGWLHVRNARVLLRARNPSSLF